MGADIHMWAEVKRTYPNPEVKAEWKTVGHVFKPNYHWKDEPVVIDEWDRGETTEWNSPLTLHPYEGRNYDLFAILANVRNGSGFAGVKTGDGFEYIDEPRGVPKDASKYYKKKVKEYGEDGHSHSYFTLAELEAFDWKGKRTRHEGYVTVEEYKVFKEKGKPPSWCGGVTGGRVEIIDEQRMDDLLDAKWYPDPKKSYYTRVWWEESYATSVGTFLTETLPALRKIAKWKYVEDVRIVFYFDN